MKLILNEIFNHKGDFEKRELQELMRRCHTQDISVHTLEVLLNHASVSFDSMEEDLTAFVNPIASPMDPTPRPGGKKELDILQKQVERWRLIAIILGTILIVSLFAHVYRI